MCRILEYFILFAVVILLQVFVFDSLQTGRYFTPFVYPAFVILLPMEISGWLLLLLAAATGVTMDVFMGTPALNTIATVFLAFCRPGVLKLFVEKDVLDEGGIPNIARLGTARFIRYSTALLLLFNAVFFVLETMTLTGIGYTLLRIVLSTAASAAVVYFCQLLFVIHKSKI